MSEYGYDSNGRCPECDGTGDNHYPGCTYDGVGSGGHHSIGNGMAAIVAIVCMIIGFVGTAFIYTLLGIDAENVPAIVSFILIMVIAFIVAIIGSLRR